MYTDPGLGSLLIQVLIGGIVGIPIVMGLFWGKIKGFIHRSKRDEHRN